MVGTQVTVVPTIADRDAPSLYEAVRDGDPALWDYLPYGPFADESSFAQWLAGHCEGTAVLPRTIITLGTDKAVGNASYGNIDEANGDIEIGHIFFSAGLQRTRAATEAIYLMMKHAMDDLGYRRLVWKCDANNARSMRAAERFGFQHEGHFRQHRVVKGKNRDTVWYSIIDSDWPEVKSAIVTWLDDANFDSDGRQRRSLSVIRRAQG